MARKQGYRVYPRKESTYNKAIISATNNERELIVFTINYGPYCAGDMLGVEGYKAATLVKHRIATRVVKAIPRTRQPVNRRNNLSTVELARSIISQ